MCSVDWLCVVVDNFLRQETSIWNVSEVFVVQVSNQGVWLSGSVVELKILVLKLVVLFVLFVRVEFDNLKCQLLVVVFNLRASHWLSVLYWLVNHNSLDMHNIWDRYWIYHFDRAFSKLQIQFILVVLRLMGCSIQIDYVELLLSQLDWRFHFLTASRLFTLVAVERPWILISFLSFVFQWICVVRSPNNHHFRLHVLWLRRGRIGFRFLHFLSIGFFRLKPLHNQLFIDITHLNLLQLLDLRICQFWLNRRLINLTTSNADRMLLNSVAMGPLHYFGRFSLNADRSHFYHTVVDSYFYALADHVCLFGRWGHWSLWR